MKRIASLGDAEDVVRILLTTEKGTTLSVEINQASAMYKNDLVIPETERNAYMKSLNR